MARAGGGIPRQSAGLSFESAAWAAGHGRVAGVDEVGRGPLAGPVTAAAVILDPGQLIVGLNDSKALKKALREQLFPEILAKATVSVVFLPAPVVDRLNIRAASLEAMRQAVAGLATAADFALIDGKDIPPGLPCPAQAIIGGDGRSASIAAASIIAKVLRDRMMARAETAYPGYGLARHAGYGTAAHRAAIAALGPCPLHRLSFAPFKNGTH